MEPGEFMAKWGVSKEELSIITSKSIETVKNWFAEGKGTKTRPPTRDVVERLTFIDLLWSKWENEEEKLPTHVKAMYSLVQSRRNAQKSYPIEED